MTDHNDITLRVRMVRADELIEKLEREQFNVGQAKDDYDRGYRYGWNSNAAELIAWLRGER